MPPPNFLMSKRRHLTGPRWRCARKPCQHRPPPRSRPGGEEKERAGFGEDQCRRCFPLWLGPAPNAKPDVILMRRQSAKRPSGVIAFALAQRHAEGRPTWLTKVLEPGECKVIEISAIAHLSYQPYPTPPPPPVSAPSTTAAQPAPHGTQRRKARRTSGDGSSSTR
jgi:hypothetical protein